MEGTAREAIHSLKYRNLKAVAPTLGQLLAQYMESVTVPGAVLVPVPLHKRRLRDRGYNQSELLAKEAGKRMSLPVMDALIIRTRNTPPQVSLSLEERMRNVEGSFACVGNAQGQRFIVVDDVVTTGSTVSACAAVLKAEGAESVWGLALARQGIGSPDESL